MHNPPASALLDLWERARPCTPAVRALRLLAFSQPAENPDTLAELDLCERDRHLLCLRQAVFGTRVEGRGRCPHCLADIEVEFDIDQVLASSPPAPSRVFVDGDGRRFRLPNSRDLLAAAVLPDVESVERFLLERCAHDGVEGADLVEVDSGLTSLAATHSFQLSMHCDICGGHWTPDFDPASFLWEELDMRARQLLDEVDRLARTYGWSERDILALGESRRAAYLERAG